MVQGRSLLLKLCFGLPREAGLSVQGWGPRIMGMTLSQYLVRELICLPYPPHQLYDPRCCRPRGYTLEMMASGRDWWERLSGLWPHHVVIAFSIGSH